MHSKKYHLCITKKGIARTQSQFHIHLSVSDLNIPRIGPNIFLQQNRQTVMGSICINRSRFFVVIRMAPQAAPPPKLLYKNSDKCL
jgi:hypothetical protein